MQDHEAKQYFAYLTTRSRVAEWFRLHISYPSVNRYLKGRVLDLGCGIGDYLRYNKAAVGADINKYNVQYCNHMGCEAYVIDNDTLPFEAHCFDGVMLDNVLEHLTGPDVVIKEISRVLKPGGILVVVVPGRKGFQMDPDHKIFYDEKKLQSLFEKHGYQLKKILYLPLFFKSDFLSRTLSQYAVNSVYKKQGLA
jgi:SAM-dependent methyltransferase